MMISTERHEQTHHEHKHAQHRNKPLGPVVMCGAVLHFYSLLLVYAVRNS